MNWEALGAIGEIVGAVAVVLTLAYLAIQIRQNTRFLRISTHHAISSRSTDVNRPIAENADFARLTQLGNEHPEELSPEDRRQYDAYALIRLRHYDDLYYQYTHGILEESHWNGFRRLLFYLVQQPGMALFWEENKRFLSDEFVAFVDSSAEKNRDRTRE